MIIYIYSYLCTIYSLIVIGGVCINFLSRGWQALYQFGVMLYLNMIQYNYLPKCKGNYWYKNGRFHRESGPAILECGGGGILYRRS